jgi:hypothetical protein
VRAPLLAALFLAAATLLPAGPFNDLPTFLANTSGLTLINFDVDPSNNPLAPGASLVGVYSSIGVDFLEGDYVGAATGPVSPPNVWFNNEFVGGLPFFRANFNVNAGTVTAVGVHHVRYSGPIADLTAYDLDGNPLATVASDSDLNTLDFFGVTTSAPISYFTVAWRSVYGWGLDDLYFGSATGTSGVPEPGSFGLASAGILAGILALAARRR